MKNPVSGIYQIINTANGHSYIGSAVNIAQRWSHHRHNMRRGIHTNTHLQHAWNKYGEERFKFSVIGTCRPDDLIRMEQHLLDGCRPEYNICLVAGSHLGLKYSSETRAKMSEARKGKKKPPFTDEHRANLGAALKGRKLPLRTNEHQAKISAANKGKKRSLETRQKISAARMGQKPSLGTRAKMSMSAKRRWQVIDIE